ncbi:MAG: hypothetical protein NVSMB9_00620 [Isosphaeraceae bacterium]
MELEKQLTAGGNRVYDLKGPAFTTSRHTYLRAGKRFSNFRYPAESLDIAAEIESLDVLVRVPLHEKREESFGASEGERESVLSLAGVPWFLETIDWISDPKEERTRPWLVTIDPHATQVFSDDVSQGEACRIVRMMTEMLSMLETLHRAGYALGDLDAGDFLIDFSGRWFYLGSDLVHTAQGPESTRSDLVSWARLCEGLLGAGASSPGTKTWPVLESQSREMHERSSWLFERVQRCLFGEGGSSPATVGDLETAPSRFPRPFRRWRQLLGLNRGRA